MAQTKQRWIDPAAQQSYEGEQRKPTDVPWASSTQTTPEPTPEPKTDTGVDKGAMRETLSGIQTQLEGLQERAAELKVEEPESPIQDAQHLLDELTPEAQLAQMEADRQRQMEELKVEEQKLLEERRGLVDKASDFMKGRTTEERVKDLQEEYEVSPMMKEARGALSQALEFQQRAIGLTEQRDAAVAAVGQQAISTPFLNRQEARVAENYDRRIASMSAMAGAQSSYAQAVQGQVSQARALIGDIVNAYTYDTQLELDRINMFMDLNKEEIEMLDRDYQNALQESQRYWENQLKEEKAESEAKLEMMATSEGQANITLNDTLEEAMEKYGNWTGTQIPSDTKSLFTEYPEAFADMTESQMKEMSFVEAVNRITKWEASRPAEIDIGDYFSPQEQRELRREGIDLTTSEGLREGMKRIREEDREMFWSRESMAKSEPPVWFDTVYRKITGTRDNVSIVPELFKRVWDQYRQQVVEEGWTEPSPTSQQYLEQFDLDWRVPGEREKAIEKLEEQGMYTPGDLKFISPGE